MVSFKFLVPTLLLAASGVVAAPVAKAQDVPEIITPSPHTHVSAWSLWGKRSTDAGVQRRQDDFQIDPELLSGLGPSSISYGTAEVKTKAFDLWSPSSWGWWKRSANAGVQRRQDDPQIDPELLASLGPSISFGTAEVKTKAFDLWSPSTWGWWKRSINTSLQQRDEPELDPETVDLLKGINHGVTQVHTTSFDLWSPSTWWGWWN